LENNDEYAKNIDNIIKNYKKYKVNKNGDDTKINYIIISTLFVVNDKIIGNMPSSSLLGKMSFIIKSNNFYVIHT